MVGEVGDRGLSSWQFLLSFVFGCCVGRFLFPFVGSCVNWVGGFVFFPFVFCVVVVWAVSFGIDMFMIVLSW